MRPIDADALCTDLLDRWSVAETRKEELIKAVMADIVTPIIASQPTIEPEQSQFIVEPQPCCIPFSTMQRVCKHRRTGGIVYGGDAKPRDACHYDMYRSLWDECSMRNCPILNRREIE